MTIDSWVRKRTYDAFREFVGSGMNYHLQANEFIRDVFELGPPVLVDAATLKSMKISRFERVSILTRLHTFLSLMANLTLLTF